MIYPSCFIYLVLTIFVGDILIYAVFSEM